MNQAIRIAAGVVIIWLGLLMCSGAYKSLALPQDVESTVPPPSIESIRELADLVVLEVQASEVVSAEVRGHTGGTSVIVLVHGDVMLGIDLEQAHFTDVDEDSRHLVLALPAPTVRRVAIDHHASRTIHSGRDGLWRLAIGPAKEEQAIANAFMLGTQRLKEVAVGEDLTRRAKQHAGVVLGGFTDETGWTLEIRWDE